MDARSSKELRAFFIVLSILLFCFVYVRELRKQFICLYAIKYVFSQNNCSFIDKLDKEMFEIKQIKLQYLLMFLVFWVLISCDKRNENEILVKNDSIMADEPLLAKEKLDSLSPYVKSLSVSNQMYYAMLKTDVNNKLYNLFTTDTLMKPAADWYAKHGSTMEKVRAYYLLGAVYRDMNDFPKAIDYLLRADEFMENSSDAEWKWKILSELANCYNLMGGKAESLNYNEQLLELALRNKMNSLPDAYLNVGFSYLINYGQPQKALPYFRKADSIASNSPSYVPNPWIWLYNAKALIALGHLQQGLYFLNKIMYNKTLDDFLYDKQGFREELNLTKVSYLMKEPAQNTDSLYKYINLSLRSSDKDILADTYNLLSSFYRSKGDFRSAYIYSQKLNALQEQIHEERMKSMAIHAHSLHDYYKETYKNELNLTFIIILLAGGCILVIIIFVLYFLYQKKKEKEERLFQRNKKNYAFNMQLKEEINDLKQYAYLVPKTYKERSLSILRTSDVCKKLHSMAKDKEKMSDDDFSKLCIEIDSLFIGFTERLRKIGNNLSEQEFRLCLLVKSEFKNKESANLLCLEASSVSHYYERICLKLTKKKGKFNDLRAFLSDI